MAKQKEVQLELGVTRAPGRPCLGDEPLTPAQKQARYRLNKQRKSVTVTFSRNQLEELDFHIRSLRNGGTVVDLSPEALEGVYRAIRDAAFFQLPPV